MPPSHNTVNNSNLVIKAEWKIREAVNDFSVLFADARNPNPEKNPTAQELKDAFKKVLKKQRNFLENWEEYLKADIENATNATLENLAKIITISSEWKREIANYKVHCDTVQADDDGLYTAVFADMCGQMKIGKNSKDAIALADSFFNIMSSNVELANRLDEIGFVFPIQEPDEANASDEDTQITGVQVARLIRYLRSIEEVEMHPCENDAKNMRLPVVLSEIEAAGGIRIGDRIQRKRGDHMREGTITDRYVDGTIARITYVDGEVEDIVGDVGYMFNHRWHDHLVPEYGRQLFDRVQGWKQNDDWYQGTITHINEDGTVQITYDDGEVEDTVEEDRMRGFWTHGGKVRNENGEDWDTIDTNDEHYCEMVNQDIYAPIASLIAELESLVDPEDGEVATAGYQRPIANMIGDFYLILDDHYDAFCDPDLMFHGDPLYDHCSEMVEADHFIWEWEWWPERLNEMNYALEMVALLETALSHEVDYNCRIDEADGVVWCNSEFDDDGIPRAVSDDGILNEISSLILEFHAMNSGGVERTMEEMSDDAYDLIQSQYDRDCLPLYQNDYIPNTNNMSRWELKSNCTTMRHTQLPYIEHISEWTQEVSEWTREGYIIPYGIYSWIAE